MSSPPSQAPFYDAFASQYDSQLTARPRQLWVRRVFQELVARSAPRGSLLLDFGCGTGLDAAWYAGHGYRVLAYDISVGMVDQLRRRCTGEIARGAVVPLVAPFEQFTSTVAAHPRPAAVVANYGVLNAIPRPRAFFEAVAHVLAPGAPLVISVLSPFYWRDMLRPWWWRALRRSGLPRAIVTRGEGIDTYRHFISSLTDAARPEFRLRSRRVPWRTLGLWVFLRFERT